MKWETAIWTLNNRDEAEEQNPDAVLDAIRAIIDMVEDHCSTDTTGMADWIANGDWSGSATPQQIAEEWDMLTDGCGDSDDDDTEWCDECNQAEATHNRDTLLLCWQCAARYDSYDAASQ
jgi:hypothetical protein